MLDRPSNQERVLRSRFSLLTVVFFCLILAYAVSSLHLLDSCFHNVALRHLSVEERAARILTKFPLIDGHNDLLIAIRFLFKNQIYGNFSGQFESLGMPGQVDLPRLSQGKVGGAFWSAFVPCPANASDFSDEAYAPYVRATFEQLDLFHRLADRYPKTFSPPKDSSAASRAFQNGYLISPAAIEGLHQVGNSVSTLRNYHRLGVRYATLTWNCHNAYADAALTISSTGSAAVATPLWYGVSPAGRDLILEMNRLGMLVDLSHTSPDTMRDVLGASPAIWNGSVAPPIFSHSSAYALCPHPRNVPDDVLQLVKRRNALVMVNFTPEFVACVPGNASSGLPDPDPENATLERVADHVMYISNKIGFDHVGVGSDFDGMLEGPKGLEDVSKFPDLVAELLRRGVSDHDAVKVIGGNLLRVWKDADKVAAILDETTTPLEDDLGPMRSQRVYD